MASIEELESSLPNGLHDAKLFGVKVDYERGELVMSIAADVSEPDASKKPHYRRGELYVTGLMSLVLDAPSSVSEAKPLWIDAGPGQPSTSPISMPSLPDGCFLHWFFVSEWNGFIRVAARNAEWRWTDDN